MTDFVLPTQSSFDALTTSGYTMTDSDAGFLTKEVGGVIKLLVDQMASSELVHIRAVRTSTGKTEKFIIDNIADWSAGPKIVTSDHFVSTLLDCTNFFTYTGNDAKIFKDTLFTLVVGTNDGGEPITLTQPMPEGTDDIVMDLTASPVARSQSQVAGHRNWSNTMDAMVNSSDTALGLEADVFAPELVIVMPNPISTMAPAWDSNGHINHFTSAFNCLPVNGVMMVNHVEFQCINDAIWLVLEAHKSVGHTYEATWIKSEGTELDVACIKRLS
tara:strand:+ start:1329 stop:2147 length:819 start_codon:yes stop_codon:yes gene_type:complete